MNCRDLQSLLTGYFDGELDLVRSLEIEQHLEDCAACSQEHRNLQAVRSAIQSGALYFKPPAGLQKRIQKSVREANKAELESPGTAVKSLRTGWAVPWRGLGFAAVLLLAAALVWSLVRISSVPSADELLAQEVVSDHIRSLQEKHLVDVTSANPHTVKPWFNGRLDFSPPVVDTVEQGFPLVGGRLDYLDHRAVAALVYQRRQHLINVFIWPSTRASETGESRATRQGYNLIRWSKGGMNYWAVSDLNNKELQEFVSLIQNYAPLTTTP